jgi:hypothetical protein
MVPARAVLNHPRQIDAHPIRGARILRAGRRNLIPWPE